MKSKSKINTSNFILANPKCEALCNFYYLKRNYLYLTNYLEIVSKLNCTEVLLDECNQRHMNYTKFTDLVYDRTCNRNKMIDECLPLLNNIYNNSKISKNWKNIVFKMHNLTVAQLQMPCTQIALYDRILLRRNYSYGMFHEARKLNLPFCEESWCGLDEEHKHLLSPGFCISQTRFVGKYFIAQFYSVIKNKLQQLKVI